MQVSKWGNSLAIRLPAAVVEALNLKEGDEIEIQVAGSRAFDVARDRSREEALQRDRQWPIVQVSRMWILSSTTCFLSVS